MEQVKYLMKQAEYLMKQDTFQNLFTYFYLLCAHGNSIHFVMFIPIGFIT